MRIRLSLLQLLFVLFGISHCENIRGSVLYENASTGKSYDITANAGAGYGLYSVFPFYGGSGNLFPTTSYYTLTAPIAYLRVKRLSGVACNVPANVTLASEQGGSLGVVGIGAAVGEFCDFPVTGTSAGQKLSAVFICINNQCSGANGTLVLDGSISNSGYAIDGTQTIKQPGGWAFQVCDNNGCSGGFTASQCDTASFGAKTDFGTGIFPLSVAVGDFNGDGKLDLAVANIGSDTVSILLGTGTGSFGAKTDFGTGNGPASVAVGDFNGDGKLDLAVANVADTVSILLGTGTGSFGAKTDFATSILPASGAVGDFIRRPCGTWLRT